MGYQMLNQIVGYKMNKKKKRKILKLWKNNIIEASN